MSKHYLYNVQFKRGQKVIVLPEWDGHRLSDNELVKLSKRGKVAQIKRLEEPYRLIGKDYSDELLYKRIVVKTKSKIFSCHPMYYRLLTFPNLWAAKKRLKYQI